VGDQIIYLIDADVLIAIRKKKDSQKIYDHLIGMAEDGDLKTVRQVFVEIERHGSFFKFLLDRKAKFVLPVEQQYCSGVQKKLDFVGNKANYLNEQTGSKDRADPWLVAVAAFHKFTLVTNESQSSTRRIPAACKIPELYCRCISGPHFLYEVKLVQRIDPAHISVQAFFAEP